MIHLDTNLLIAAADQASPGAARIEKWLLGGEKLAASAIAWAEFMSGPLTARQINATAVLLEDRIIPFQFREAVRAAQLFNEAGRRRNTRLDCFIAATAICAHASLATEDRRDFLPFVDAGLRLAL